MNLCRRHQQRWVLIGVLALFAQLLLPIVHAQAWASRNGDARLYAFCGQVSAALIEKLRTNLPPELLKRDTTPSDPLSCSLCAAVHGANIAGGTFPPRLSLFRPQLATDTARTTTPPAIRRVVLPQLRGPPVFS